MPTYECNLIFILEILFHNLGNYFICILYMSDWLKFLQTQLAENPGKPLKEVIEIAKINIKKKPQKNNKSKRKNNSKNTR